MVEKTTTPTVTPAQPAPSVIPTTEETGKLEQLEKLSDAHNEVKETQEDALIPSEDYRSSPLLYELTNCFRMPQSDWDNASLELSAILDFVIKDIKSNDEDKVLLKLRELEDNLYTRPNEGEKRYQVLYRYIRLASRKQAIERSMKAFEKEKTNG